MLTRRHLLTTVAVLPLAACAAGVVPGPTPAPGPIAEYVADAKLVADMLLSLLGTVGGLVGISPATLARVTSYVNQAKVLADSIAVAVDAATAKSLVQRFLAAAQGAADALSGMSGLPTEAVVALTAARVLLPIIAAAVGLFMAPPRVAGAMSPRDARATLARYARL